jgi:hypothetical protein
MKPELILMLIVLGLYLFRVGMYFGMQIVFEVSKATHSPHERVVPSGVLLLFSVLWPLWFIEKTWKRIRG